MWSPDGFEAELRAFLVANLPEEPARIQSAILYSSFSGGKRIRPRLLAAVARSLGLSEALARRLGIALELIHTYTLIHDDLPAMDDDDLRRGKPTLHRAFDEATALLAGDALIALGFDAILSLDGYPESSRLRAMRILSDVAGARGVIAGQLLETLDHHSIEHWLKTAALKTGALFQACFDLPACFAAEPAAFHDLGLRFGIAFQIADDLEDPPEEATENLGNLLSLEARGQALNRASSMVQSLRREFEALPEAGALMEILSSLEGKLNA